MSPSVEWLSFLRAAPVTSAIYFSRAISARPSRFCSAERVTRLGERCIRSSGIGNDHPGFDPRAFSCPPHSSCSLSLFLVAPTFFLRPSFAPLHLERARSPGISVTYLVPSFAPANRYRSRSRPYRNITLKLRSPFDPGSLLVPSPSIPIRSLLAFARDPLAVAVRGLKTIHPRGPIFIGKLR